MTWFSTPLKRNTRRVLCVAAVVSLFIFFFGGLFSERFLIPPFLFFILYVLSVVWLNKATGNMALAKEHKLDERQRGLRNRAYWLTYTVFSLYALLMVLISTFGFGDLYIPFGESNSTVMTLLLLANVQLVVALPVLYVAWLEPDPLTEDSNLDLSLKGDAS